MEVYAHRLGESPISPAVEMRLRVWARLHYSPVKQRDPKWHPVILQEMDRKDREMVPLPNASNLDEELAEFLQRLIRNPAEAFESYDSLRVIRQVYLEHECLITESRNEEFDEYRAISKWYCTDVFVVLLTEHFRQAKQAAIRAGN